MPTLNTDHCLETGVFKICGHTMTLLYFHLVRTVFVRRACRMGGREERFSIMHKYHGMRIYMENGGKAPCTVTEIYFCVPYG
jgi:hypothetical protein